MSEPTTHKWQETITLEVEIPDGWEVTDPEPVTLQKGDSFVSRWEPGVLTWDEPTPSKAKFIRVRKKQVIACFGDLEQGQRFSMIGKPETLFMKTDSKTYWNAVWLSKTFFDGLPGHQCFFEQGSKVLLVDE